MALRNSFSKRKRSKLTFDKTVLTYSSMAANIVKELNESFTLAYEAEYRKKYPMMKLTKGILIGFLFFAGLNTWAQEVSIQLGPNEIGLNQYYSITLTAKNGNIREYGNFPEIPGMVKRGINSSSSTSYVNGQISSQHSIIQNYQPTQKGNFQLSDFSIRVNGQMLSSEGATIKVGDRVQQQRRRSLFNYGDPFNEPAQAPEFLDIKADAFLAFTLDKTDVFVGEGFNGTLAFYVAQNNRADMRFHELGRQVTEIIKKLKPENCWEENFNIENIQGETVLLNGKKYTQYKVYRATYYPLNVQDIEFPSVGLELIKFDVAKNPTFFGQNRQQNFKTFYSSPKVVRVKDLPPHPLKDRVAVGRYRLKESLEPGAVETGQSFNFIFSVSGEGNISAIEEPIIPPDGRMEFYAPNVQQDINRTMNRVTGTKAFNYYGIPQEPGTYMLSDYFKWIYFDPVAARYDTLSATKTLNVTGESKKNASILSNDVGSFYDRINVEDNRLSNRNRSNFFGLFATVAVFILLGFTSYLMFRKT